MYLFKKWNLALTLGALSLAAPSSPLFAQFYLGAFGGGGHAEAVDVRQRGFAFNNTDATQALSVNATGKTGNFGSYLVGGHLGYDIKTKMWLVPAVEFEGFYLQANTGKQTGFLMNPTLAEHTFVNTLPLRVIPLFADVILAVRFPHFKWIEPYVGGGIGGALMMMSHAHSEQLSPPEPGINHFNSKTSASDSALAAQFKGGLRINLSRHWRLFGEYRYLYLGPTTYMFGFTQYPSVEHAPTSNWIVHLEKLHYNLGVGGLEYTF